MINVKIIVSLMSLSLLSGCASLQYKDLAQYNIILNCKKVNVNVMDKLANGNKVLLQKSNFGFNTKEGRMVYEINQDGEYQYAYYHSKKSGKVFYKSVSEDIMLAIGSSKDGTFVAMSRPNATYTFFDCTKR